MALEVEEACREVVHTVADFKSAFSLSFNIPAHKCSPFFAPPSPPTNPLPEKANALHGA